MDDAEPIRIDLLHRSCTPVRLKVRSKDRFVADTLSRALSVGNDFTVLAQAQAQAQAQSRAEPIVEIAIDDCRRAFPHVAPNALNADANCRPSLALIHSTQDNRLSAYRTGYADFIVWPIVNAEVHARVGARCLDLGRTSARYLFAKDPLVERCCRHLSEHLAANFPVRDLARSFGTNHNSLNRKFQRALNMTPAQWLRYMRMQSAARQLVLTTLPVSAIAGAVGYDRAENFATAFRRRYGMSPREFRRVNEEQE